MTMKFGRLYYLIMETVCLICFQKLLLSVRISYILSIMFLELGKSIELGFRYKSGIIKKLVVNNKKLKILHSK